MTPLNLKAFLMVVVLGNLGFTLLYLLTRIPYIGLLFYIQMLLALVGVGASYANLAQQYGTKLDVPSTGLYGGITALLVTGVTLGIAAASGTSLVTLAGLAVLALILGAIGGALYPAVMDV